MTNTFSEGPCRFCRDSKHGNNKYSQISERFLDHIIHKDFSKKKGMRWCGNCRKELQFADEGAEAAAVQALKDCTTAEASQANTDAQPSFSDDILDAIRLIEQ